MIRLKYFARLSEVFDSKAEEIEFGEQSKTVGTVIKQLIKRGEPWATEFSAETNFLIAVNHEMCDTDTELKEGDELAFFPPVTGG